MQWPPLTRRKPVNLSHGQLVTPIFPWRVDHFNFRVVWWVDRSVLGGVWRVDCQYSSHELACLLTYAWFPASRNARNVRSAAAVYCYGFDIYGWPIACAVIGSQSRNSTLSWHSISWLQYFCYGVVEIIWRLVPGRLEQWLARHNHCAMVDAVNVRSKRYLVIPFCKQH